MLTDRKETYNVQILQDWKTFRWSRITVLSDPVAKLIRMKGSRVFRFHMMCWSQPDPSNDWATKLEDVWNENGSAETLDLTSREVQFIWHLLSSASTLDIKKHNHTHLNMQNRIF